MNKEEGNQILQANNQQTNNQKIVSKQSHHEDQKIQFSFDQQDLTSLEPRLTHQYLKQLFSDSKVDYAIGSMFGAFIGDSLGSYCQFRNHISQELLEETMQMRGGGTFSIRAGQFTDDSQMATHMLSALSKYDNTKNFSEQEYFLLKEIAKQYTTWGKSDPFDIGMTTRSAIYVIGKHLYDEKVQQKNLLQEQFIKTILPQIKEKNKNSQANGSLMRITPMCLFSSYIKDKQTLENFIKSFKISYLEQIQLTHPNQTLVAAGYAWVQLLNKIINRKTNQSTLLGIYNQFIQKYQKDELLNQWIDIAKQKGLMPGVPNMGWAKIAFSYGINKLRSISSQSQESLNEKIYINSIKEVIGKAGDTDTNGAIVGGLIGSILGFKRLPKKYIQKLFKLRLSEQMKNCSYRGQFYQPRRAFIKGINLIQKLNKKYQK